MRVLCGLKFKIGTNAAEVLRKVIQDGLKYEKFTILVDNSGSMESYVNLFASLLDSLNPNNKNVICTLFQVLLLTISMLLKTKKK